MLERYDREVRRGPPPPDPRYRCEIDGPVYRLTGPGSEPEDNAVLWSGFAGGDDPARHIARQVVHYGALGHAFEWQRHAHDLPADLDDHLRAAGLSPGASEAVLEAPSSPSLTTAVLPGGVTLERVARDRALDAVGALNEAVYGDAAHAEYLVRSLASERAADPDALSVWLARAGEQVVAAAWARYPAGTVFVTLWGGATLPAWRGRGIYRALVAARSGEARARGRERLLVYAGPHSEPILRRLGFVELTRVTPWVWRPNEAALPDSGAAVGRD